MLDFFKRNRQPISVVLILLSFFILISSQAEETRSDNWLTATVQTVAYPFQASSHYVTSKVVQTWSHYFHLIGVAQENKTLRKRVKELKEKNSRYKEVLIAYRRLRENLNFQITNPDEKLFAEVIGELQKGASQLLVINKGSNHGIRRNFSVVTYDGVIGKIQSVTSIQSVVQLITDAHSQVPVLIQRTRTKAILSGSYDGTLVLERIPRRLVLKRNDLVITSGLAGIYPKGFTVGKIDQINKKEFGLFQSVTLTPSVDLNKIEDVAVILKSVNNIQQPLFTDSKK